MVRHSWIRMLVITTTTTINYNISSHTDDGAHTHTHMKNHHIRSRTTDTSAIVRFLLLICRKKTTINEIICVPLRTSFDDQLRDESLNWRQAASDLSRFHKSRVFSSSSRWVAACSSRLRERAREKVPSITIRCRHHHHHRCPRRPSSSVE